MQRISTKSQIYLSNKNKSPSIFLFTDVGIATQNTHIVLPSKKIQKRDVIGMILAGIYMLTYSRHEVVCETCFRVNNQGIGVQYSSFSNTDFELVNIGWDNPC